jgi:hypothetical protein
MVLMHLKILTSTLLVVSALLSVGALSQPPKPAKSIRRSCPELLAVMKPVGGIERESFFFRENNFAEAKAMLQDSKNVGSQVFWKKVDAAGFDVLVEIEHQSTSGRLQKMSGRVGAVSDTGIKLRSDDGDIVELDYKKLETEIVRISLSRKRFTLPKELAKIKKNSDFAKALGIQYLTRTMEIPKLAEALKQKSFKPSSNEWQWNPAVYMGLLTDFRRQRIYPGKDVLLYFDVKLLDRDDFWINPGWDNGTFDDRSVFVKDPNFRTAIYLYAIFVEWGHPGRNGPELVFAKEVASSHLKRIFTVGGRQEEYTDYLRQTIGPDFASSLEGPVSDDPKEMQ